MISCRLRRLGFTLWAKAKLRAVLVHLKKWWESHTGQAQLVNWREEAMMPERTLLLEKRRKDMPIFLGCRRGPGLQHGVAE